MTPDERNLIAGLFDRLHQADTSPKDREAEQLIQAKVAEQPAAPYLLAQTVLVQEHALTNAQARIAQLERQAAQASTAQSSGGGSFLSGLFGGHPTPSTPPPVPQPTYPSTVNMAPGAGGGFLRTALAAAAGVAGGSLLFNGIEGLLGHNSGVFGSSLGGGSGFFGGGAGRPEVIENNEVVNNYYDGGGSSIDPGAQAADFPDTPPPMDDAPTYQEADYTSDDSGSSDDFSGGDSFSSDDGGGLV